MKTIVGSYRFLRVLFYALVVLIVAYTSFPRADRKTKGKMLQYYPRRVLELAGVKCSFTGNVPESIHQYGLSEEAPGVMLVSNHVSWLDIFSLDSQAPSRFIAKAEIAKWPIFGLIAQAIGTLFINRSSKRAILKINDDISGALAQKETVMVFAEGTTTFGNELLPIRTNFLQPACEIGATVQPVILCYTSKGVPSKQAAFSGDVSLFGSLWNVVTMEDAAVTVHFLEPIKDTANLSRHQVGELCQERMQLKLKELWGENYVAHDPNADSALAKVISKG